MATFLGAFESFITQTTENSPSEAVEGKSHTFLNQINKIKILFKTSTNHNKRSKGAKGETTNNKST